MVPPDTGICHQVNLEYLAKVVFTHADGQAFPDTLVGTDSHTPMVNGIGRRRLGRRRHRGRGGHARPAHPHAHPEGRGPAARRRLPEGATATDLVLTVTELLREQGVVGKFVEVFGPGVATLPVENRADIGNMSPEYGSTITICPVDAETLRYLASPAVRREQVALVEAYAKEQGLWHDPQATPIFSARRSSSTSPRSCPSLAGPSRPQDRVPLDRAKSMFAKSLPPRSPRAPPSSRSR